jgi:hypothetical protein
MNLTPVHHARDERDICECCKALFDAVTAELDSYLAAVENTYGREMAEKAGALWLDIFDQSGVMNDPPNAGLRSITILAASRFVSFMSGIALADARCHGQNQGVARADGQALPGLS